MGNVSNVVTRVSRPDGAPPFVIAPNLTYSKLPQLNNIPYSTEPNANQPQPTPTNPNPVPLMAQQKAGSKPTSSFTWHSIMVSRSCQDGDFQQQDFQCQMSAHPIRQHKGFHEHQI